MADNPMTVGELKESINDLPDDVRIFLESPEGLLISVGKLDINRKFVNWFGELVTISGNCWSKYPDSPY